jgi:hypothetical protein
MAIMMANANTHSAVSVGPLAHTAPAAERPHANNSTNG